MTRVCGQTRFICILFFMPFHSSIIFATTPKRMPGNIQMPGTWLFTFILKFSYFKRKHFFFAIVIVLSINFRQRILCMSFLNYYHYYYYMDIAMCSQDCKKMPEHIDYVAVCSGTQIFATFDKKGIEAENKDLQILENLAARYVFFFLIICRHL